MFYLDDYKKNLTRELETYEAAVKAWQELTFPRKKDGTPFQNMSKNVAGQHVKVEEYWQGTWKIKIWFYLENGWARDDELQFNDGDFPCADMVQKRIDELNVLIEELKHDIAVMDDAYKACIVKLFEVQQTANSILTKSGANRLIWEIKDELPYCELISKKF